MERLYIVKIGGNIIDDDNQLQSFLESFSAIDGKKILVHGGGKRASELSLRLGIVPQMVDGRRITDADTLFVITMVYGGLVNKTIVAGLQGLGCNAVGLSGADGNIIPATKRPVKEIDYGFAGDVDSSGVNLDMLGLLLANGFTPVIAPLTHDGNGTLLNTNADTIAAALAGSLSGSYDVELIYCFEKDGILKDVNDENSLLEKVSSAEYDIMKKDGIVSNGMIPKLDNAFSALRMGVRSVYVAHAKAIKNIRQNNGFRGTQLYND